MLQEDRSASLSSSAVLQFVPLMSNFSGSGSPYPCLKELNSEQRGLCLIHLLKACTNHVAAGNTEAADICLYKIAELASPDGDTIQRISAYFSEALADRLLKSWPGLRKALNSTKMFSMSERFLAQRLFFDLCPFLKISYLITNQAIVEAMEGERVVHVIDLCSFEPAQWVNLIQTLSMRPEGPPFLKITGIHEQKEVLDQMALRLTEEAENLNIPFQFYPVVSKLEKLDVDSLRVKTGEALAISSVLKLHNLLAADDETSAKNSPAGTKHLSSSQLQRILMSQNQQILGEWLKKESSPIDCTSPDSALSPLSAAAKPRMGSFLSELRSLSPKIMVITEQESNNNSLTLMERVDKALNFYAALFDCLESTVSRASMERQKLEKFLFGEEINNIITSEGMERKERHEKLDKWILRLELAGFGRIPLSYHGMLQASTLLRSFGYDGCKIREENGCVVICWQDAPLFSVSAWRFRRYE